MSSRRAAVTSRRRSEKSHTPTLLRAVRRRALMSRGLLGRHLSVRAKLTVWYGGMVAITLAAVGLAMLWELDQRTQARLDTDLQSNAELIARQVHSPGKVHRNSCSREDYNYCGRIQQVLNETSSALSEPGLSAQVEFIDYYAPRQGNVPLRPNSHLPISLGAQSLVEVIQKGDRGFFTIHRRLIPGESVQTFRVYVQILAPPKPLTGANAVLEVFQNEKTYLAVQHDFQLILLIGLPFGLIVALLAGWIIARAALRPIARISRTVRTIGESRDLSRRINFVGRQDEVGLLADTFDAMMVRLEKAFETQKRFIADASHELRTPLTAIRGNADLMTIAPASERDICLTAIRQESERMSRLVNDLLLLAEADIEEQPVSMRLIDLDDVVREAYHSAQVVARHRVALILEHVEPVSVCADSDRIKQLLLNLLDNAVKFTPQGGTVSLSLRVEGNNAKIEVADSGVGIPLNEQEAIFERFYRVEEARSKRGSGLGLAICSWIVAVHQGTIAVRSVPEKGSTFTVHLPMAEAGQASSVATMRNHTASRAVL